MDASDASNCSISTWQARGGSFPMISTGTKQILHVDLVSCVKVSRVQYDLKLFVNDVFQIKHVCKHTCIYIYTYIRMHAY